MLNHTGDCTKSGGSCSRGYQVGPKPDEGKLAGGGERTRASFSVLNGSEIKPRRAVNNDVPPRFSSIITTPNSIILPSSRSSPHASEGPKSCRLNRESPRAMSSKEGAVGVLFSVWRATVCEGVKLGPRDGIPRDEGHTSLKNSICLKIEGCNIGKSGFIRFRPG